MNIKIANRHTSLEKLEKKYPNAKIIDVTSKAEQPYVQFSPFYPVGDVPVPFSNGLVSASVEGLWQGLKVFESEGVDTSKFDNTTMKQLKRTVRKYGTCLGHQKGVDSEELLGYIEARKLLYLPSYKWVLDNKLQKEVLDLRALAEQEDIVLLDYETNGNVEDPAKPLSHAWLLKYYIEGIWPEFDQ